MFLASLTVVGAFFAAQALHRPGADSSSSPVVSETEDPQWAIDALARGDLNVASPELASGRPVYRYSVVPGGTHSPDELREAIKVDAVVAAHYEHLDQSRLRMEVVPSDRLVHVSYRKGDRVFWTAKKVLLRKGETILTDGTTQVRARCGNCIAEEPAGPTSAEEPDAVEFDRLVDAPPASSAPDVALVPAALPQPQGLAAGNPSSSAPIASSMSGSRPGSSSFPGGAPLGGGSQGIGAGTPDPLVSATKAGGHDTGSTPGLPDTGSPGKPGDNDPPNDLPAPPGSDEPFPPINPFPPGPDNPFPPGIDDPFPPGTDNPFPPGPDNPFPPENPPPGGPDNPIPPGDHPPGSPENPAPIPEPGTLLLVGGGAAELIRRLRRRSMQQ